MWTELRKRLPCSTCKLRIYSCLAEWCKYIRASYDKSSGFIVKCPGLEATNHEIRCTFTFNPEGEDG